MKTSRQNDGSIFISAIAEVCDANDPHCGTDVHHLTRDIPEHDKMLMKVIYANKFTAIC